MTTPEYHTSLHDLGDTIAQALMSAAVLTKRHRTTLRLTPAGKVRMARRLRELCAAQLPGTEIRTALNHEFVLNWTLAAYFRLVQHLNLPWIPTPRAGRQKGATEYLPEDQWKLCYEDPAYEARKEIRDRLICRECVREALADPTLRVPLLKDGSMQGKGRHLDVIHHMKLKEYQLRNPVARIFTFERIAQQTRVDVQKLMDDYAKQYATPEELAAAQKDPRYEKRNGISDRVICRKPRCGFKSLGRLDKHFRQAHEMDTEEIEEHRREYHWPPIMSADDLAKHAEREQASRKELRRTGWRPVGWKKWPLWKRAVGIIIIENPGLEPRDIGVRMDEERPPFRCPESWKQDSWERAFTTPGPGATWLSRLREKLRH
jgi:hypothetical protein